MANFEEHEIVDLDEYQGQENCRENVTSQNRDYEEDKQLLLEADQLLSLRTAVFKKQPQPRPMYISPEIHPSAKSVLTTGTKLRSALKQPRWPRSIPPSAQNQLVQYVPNHYLAQQQTNTGVVVAQQIGIIVLRQNIPSWIGSDALILWSIFSVLCCGLIPGLFALLLAGMAHSKRSTGEIQEARAWSIATIGCNMLIALVGLVTLIVLFGYFTAH